jgi:hypothetical protein
MAAIDSQGSAPRLGFTLAAWLSLLVPLVTAAWFYIDANQRPPGPDHDRPPIVLAILLAIFVLSFVAGCVSLFGIPRNGALAILPPAVLGIVVSILLALLAAFFLTISGLPPN